MKTIEKLFILLFFITFASAFPMSMSLPVNPYGFYWTICVFSEIFIALVYILFIKNYD